MIMPEHPRTYENIEALASATDEDGNPIDYQFQWLLDGQAQCEGSTLDCSLTTKEQQWECRAWAIDSQGGRSHAGSCAVTIANSPPTQPVVELLPDPYEEDKDLVVDVMIYSTDPDGDAIGYDFRWFKSTDGGASWIHKAELDASSLVSEIYIHTNDLWRVEYIPYEKTLAQQRLKGRSAPELKYTRVEGQAALDQLFTGSNNPPALAFGSLKGWVENGVDAIKATWTASDADEDAMTVGLFWTDKETSGFVPLASGLPGTQHNLITNVALPADRLIYLHAVVTDAKGAITHATSDAI